MSHSKTYQIIFRQRQKTPDGRERLRRALFTVGLFPVDLVEQEDGQGLSVSYYLDNRKKARKISYHFTRKYSKGFRISWKALCEPDWSTRWKKDWKPFALTRRFHVIPLWQALRTCPKTKEPIFLETTNAFGTGFHETTRFTAQLIESLAGQYTTFLDVGTGTGILSIVAKKCGAKRIEAFDIDPEAVRVAQDNLKANRVRCRALKMCNARYFYPSEKFDLVAANLLTHDLCVLRKRIVSWVKPGGFLIISGISLKNVTMVQKEFADSPLTRSRVVKGREWAAILFEKEETGCDVECRSEGIH